MIILGRRHACGIQGRRIMEYQEAIDKLKKDSSAKAILGVSKIYEEIRKRNFVRWTEKYPEYWLALCEMERKDITPEFAEAVMQTLKDSNILELEMVWLFKCGEKLDIFGNAIFSGEEEEI